MTARLPFEDERFAGAVCAGVFRTGHAGTEGLDDLLRVVRRGGIMVLTAKEKTWESGFAEHVEGLAARRAFDRHEGTPPYSSMPGRADTGSSRAVVPRRR